MMMSELPWCDCKVAYGIEEEEPLWAWHDKYNYKPPLPTGWSLCETDGSGGRMVAIFRIEGEPRREDGDRVAQILSELGISTIGRGGE
jgi:hypothetical protein